MFELNLAFVCRVWF